MLVVIPSGHGYFDLGPTRFAPQDMALFIGDSRIAQNAPSMPQHGYGSAVTYEWFGLPTGWFDMAPPGDTNWSTDVGKQWNLGTSRTFGAFVAGSGGTTLLDHWDPGAGSHVAYDTAIAAHVAAGSPSLAFALCCLGPNSVQTTSSWTKADIVAAYGRLGDAIHSLNGSPLLYLDIFSEKDAVGAGFSGGFSNASYRTQMDTYRQAVLDVVGTHSCRMGPNLTGQVYADHTHPDTLGLATEIGKRVYVTVTGTRAPQMASVTIDTTRTIIRVRSNQNLGNTLASSVGGFQITDGGSAVSLSGATLVVTTNRLITITLASAIVGACTVSFASGSDAVGATLPVSASIALPDTTSIGVPLEPFFGVTPSAEPIAVMVDPQMTAQPSNMSTYDLVMA
jgi:hypothetical protein